MKTKERQQCSYLPSEQLDQAVMERFGVRCETTFGIFSMNHITNIDENVKDEVLLQRIHDFIAGYTAGNLELSGRLQDQNLWL